MVRAPSGANWEFGRFQLLPGQRLLLSDGEPVPLVSKAFDVLVVLVENRDRVVGKDELLRAIWPDVVVEEGNLSQQIFLVRKALGESAQNPQHIVTVPGYGYRFTGTATQIPADAQSDTAAPPAAVKTPYRARRAVISGLILLTVALVTGLLLKRSDPALGDPWMDPAAVRIQKITETGRGTHATLSPDGRYVAYVESEGDEYSLYVQQIATGGKTAVLRGQTQRLTYLRFSNDGASLYFVRGTLGRGGFALFRVPSIGGSETPVLDNVDTPISFSPDGRQFAFMRGAGPQTHIVIAETGGGTQRTLKTQNDPLAFSFVAPAWSPDGKWIAASMAESSKGDRSSIVLLPTGAGNPRELYVTAGSIGALRWLPDGAGLLTVISDVPARPLPPWQRNVTSLLGGSIWRIAYPAGKAERLTFDLSDYDLCCVDVAADGRMIVGVLNTLVSDIWIAARDRLDTPKQITSGNPVVGRHGWLPDNDTIVYRDLKGRLNAVQKDGRTLSLALPEGHKVDGGVSVCGDGRYVVFTALPGNNIWRLTPTAGAAKQLTSGSIDTNPACSADGRWVAFASRTEEARRPSARLIPIDGGEAVALVPGEIVDVLPSPRGGFISYATFEWEKHPVPLRHLRWVVIPGDGRDRVASIEVPDDNDVGTPFVWAPDESGLDYIATREGVSNIWRQPRTGGRPVQITHFTSGRIFTLAWSPDGSWLSLGNGMSRSDVVVITRK